ncbi:MAG: hypothetical protein AB7V27_10980 [Candidatus Binatia bacterium]
MLRRRGYVPRTAKALWVVLALLAQPAGGAQPKIEAGAAPMALPAGVSTASVVLYEQTDSASGNGAPAQNFGPPYEAFDSEGADDFIVTGPGWKITQVLMITTAEVVGAASVDLTFYSDAGGVPGAAEAAYTGVIPTADTPNLEITLPTPAVLRPGLHWVGIAVNQNFQTHGQRFWSNRLVQSNNPSVWRNPGNGFATGCTTFDTQIACGVGGGTNPDFLFQVIGELAEPQPVIAPATGARGLMICTLVLLIIGRVRIARASARRT